MDEIEKLKRLLPHWMEHNDDHAESYRKWAERIGSSGNEELSGILDKLYHETRKLNELLEKALKIVAGG